MSSDTGNVQAKKENRGSDSPNIELQKQESRDPQPLECARQDRPQGRRQSRE